MKLRKFPDVYAELASRLHVSRPCAKQLAYESCYEIGDPWTRYLVVGALRDMLADNYNPEPMR